MAFGPVSIGGSQYTLPPATKNMLGGVIIGDGITVDENGKINVKEITSDPTLTVANAAADAAATGVRIKMLEMTMGVDVDGITFVSAFDTLDGVELTGVWNKKASRIDF